MKFTISPRDLCTIIDHCWRCAAPDNKNTTYNTLTGIQLAFGNDRTDRPFIRAVGTDGRQMAIVTARMSDVDGAMPSSMVIDPKPLVKLRRSLGVKTVPEVTCYVGEGFGIKFDNGKGGDALREFECLCPEIEGRYPNSAGCIPDKLEKGTFTIDAEAWVEEYDRWTNYNHIGVRIDSFLGEAAVVPPKFPDLQPCKDVHGDKYEGTLCREHLFGFLQAARRPVKFKHYGPLSPLVAEFEDAVTDCKVTYLTMPCGSEED